MHTAIAGEWAAVATAIVQQRLGATGPVTFHDYTLALDGSISSHLRHRTESLDWTSVQMFKQTLQTSGVNFRKPVPATSLRDLEISWAAERQAALAAFSLGGTMVTISALLPGKDREDDTRMLGYFRAILAEEGRPLGLAAPHLADIADRPVVLSIALPTSRPDDMRLVGELEVYLAAAFFEILEDLRETHEADIPTTL